MFIPGTPGTRGKEERRNRRGGRSTEGERRETGKDLTETGRWEGREGAVGGQEPGLQGVI